MTEDDWTSQRKQTIYEESKRVMQGQKTDIDDMDDKALRTVRLNAAILAISTTGLEISGIGEVNFLLAGFSILSFVSSAIFGVIVYNESNILVGPKSSFLGKMRTQRSDDEWKKNYLRRWKGGSRAIKQGWNLTVHFLLYANHFSFSAY